MTSSALPSTTLHPAPGAAAVSLTRVRALACITFGVALTVAMSGYQFGRSNHTVYLIDALRHASPHLLANDWFATQTLQYHAAFGLLTRGLIELGAIEPAFLAGHVLLAVLLHTAWWRIVHAFGGGAAAFVLSELLFHVSAGGTGLGMYQFLQDGAFLPSNIASVACLWGIYFWMADRRGWSAVLFGVGGLFHLNYAIVAPFLWVALAALAWWRDGRKPRGTEWLGTAVMIALCLANVLPAFAAVSQRSGKLPLREFVDIYVNLRHPHHYAPRTWPVALWVSFLWPIPFALLYWRAHRNRPALAQARRACAIVGLLLVVALLGAGVWYLSETLVQLSLWRFSVFVKLLTCVGASMWIVGRVRDERLVAAIATVAGVAVIAACIVRGPYFGIYVHPVEEPAYLAACDWVRANTPPDAVFLVPPHEQEFRLRAQRAIVVNYKCVPQLSGELPAWRDRLGDVLATDIRRLPTPFNRTLEAMRLRYEELPPEHYADVAARYGARYVLVGHRLPDDWEPLRVAAMNAGATPEYFLYDLRRVTSRSFASRRHGRFGRRPRWMGKSSASACWTPTASASSRR